MWAWLLACAAPPPAGTLQVGERGEDVAAAQQAWMAAHPGVPVLHRFRTMPFLTVGAPEALPEPPPVAADVVVIDMGFDPDALVGGACFATDCAKGMGAGPRHGAHVVEVIRRDGPGLRVAGVRVFDAHGGMRLVDLLRALEWTLRAPPKVVNLSLGLADAAGNALLWGDAETCAADNPALAWLVADLGRAGTTVVAAAGDDFAADRVRAPACLPGVVAVTAADGDGPAPSANRWPTSRLAPGTHVSAGGTTASGSSLAAAAASAAVATGAW